MDEEFIRIKDEIRSMQSLIYKYPSRYHDFIRNIKNLYVYDLTEENKIEYVNNLLLLNEFEKKLREMICQYETVTNDILKYISSIHTKITGRLLLNK